MKNQILLFCATLMMAATVCPASAEEGRPEDPYMKLGMARTRAEIAIRDGMRAFNPVKNSYDEAARATELAHNGIIEKISEARDTELGKAEAGNVPYIDELELLINDTDKNWESFKQKDASAIAARYDDAHAAFEGAASLYQKLVDAEPDWKDSTVDLAALEASYLAVEGRVIQLRDDAGKAIADLQLKQKEWEAKHDEVQKKIAAHTPPAAAKP